MNSNSSLLFAMGLMIIVYYFLLIRPQQQRVKRHKEMINNLHKGDRIITQGGIFGKITNVKADDPEMEVEIASGVKIHVVKSTIQTVVDKSTPANNNQKPAVKAQVKAPAKKPAAKKPASKKTTK